MTERFILPKSRSSDAAPLLPLRIVESVAAVNAEIWDDLGRSRKNGPASSSNPFISHAFLRSLEDSGSVGEKAGWMPQHLVLEDTSGRILAVAPAYLKAHSQGEYVFDHAWADAFSRAGGRYYPKLQISVPFTPATGPRLLVGPEPGGEARRLALCAGGKAYVEKTGISSLHATFLTPPDLEAFDASDFLHRTDQQFHFRNRGFESYEGFLETLASRKRKALRKERREALANGIEIEWLTGAGLTEAALDAFFAFYMDTGGRKWGRPYLNRLFFSLVAERVADRILLVMAKRAGRYIAGALNFIGEDTIYGRYWGCTEDHPFLHFEVCYHQAIDFAISRGIATVEAGAQGEHKLARGYEPVTTHSAHFIAHSGLRQAVADYLERERREVDAMQSILCEQTPYRRGGTGPE